MDYEYFVSELKFGIASYKQIQRVLNDEIFADAGWEFVCFTPNGNGVYRRSKQ